MRPKFVFFCRVFYPNEQANSVLLTQLCRQLSKSCDVHVVCNVPSLVPLPADLRAVRVTRLSPPVVFQLRGVRVLEYLYATFALFFSMWRFGKGSTFVLWTDPPFLDTWMGFFCKLRGIRFCVWLQDWYPQNLIGMGMFRDRGRWMRRIQAWVYRSAESVICISKDTERILHRRKVFNTIVIENWAGPSEFAPSKSKARPDWGNGLARDRLTVMFAGNFGLGLDVNMLERVIANVCPSKDFLFVFLGEGMRLPEVRALASQYPNVILSKWLSREEVRDTMNQCDVHLVLLIEELMGAIFPSKIYSVMASGKPVLAFAPKHSMLFEMVERIGCGIAADSTRPLQMAAALERMRDLFKKRPTELQKMGRLGREFIENTWNDEKAAQAFLDRGKPAPADSPTLRHPGRRARL